MATKKYGVKPGGWPKHLRPDGKRNFWKRMRKYAKAIAKGQ